MILMRDVHDDETAPTAFQATRAALAQGYAIVCARYYVSRVAERLHVSRQTALNWGRRAGNEFRGLAAQAAGAASALKGPSCGSGFQPTRRNSIRSLTVGLTPISVTWPISAATPSAQFRASPATASNPCSTNRMLSPHVNKKPNCRSDVMYLLKTQ
jgi:hypothetical protein